MSRPVAKTALILPIVIAGVLVLAGLLFLRRPPSTVTPPAAPSIGAPPAAPAPPAPVDPIDQAERRLFELTNDERRRQRLPLLQYDSDLSMAARRHSEDMLRRGFFDHTNPDKETPADRVARMHLAVIGGTGENIWMWSGSSAPDLPALVPQAFADWMASPAHGENIVRPGFTRTGIGAAVSASEVRLTQLFM